MQGVYSNGIEGKVLPYISRLCTTRRRESLKATLRSKINLKSITVFHTYIDCSKASSLPLKAPTWPFNAFLKSAFQRSTTEIRPSTYQKK